MIIYTKSVFRYQINFRYYINIYTYMYIFVYIHIYIYIYMNQTKRFSKLSCLCFPADKNIAQPIQYTASFEVV